jgi:hypothetical protein
MYVFIQRGVTSIRCSIIVTLNSFKKIYVLLDTRNMAGMKIRIEQDYSVEVTRARKEYISYPLDPKREGC